MSSFFIKPEMHEELFTKSYEVLNRAIENITDDDEKLSVKYHMHLLVVLINSSTQTRLTKAVGRAMGRLPTDEMYAYAYKHGHIHSDGIVRH